MKLIHNLLPLCWLALLFSHAPLCQGQTEPGKCFTMKDFTSNSVPIFTTYDTIVARFGKPTIAHTYNVLERIGDTASKRHTLKSLCFSAKNINYAKRRDSVELHFIIFKGRFARDTIFYNGHPLCRSTSKEDVANILGIRKEDWNEHFFTVFEADWGGKIAKEELSWFGSNGYEGRGPVDFYFDRKGRLVALYFAHPNGSIIYNSDNQRK